MFIEILDRLKGERGPLLPKKKPEKELQKIRDANFEKAKPALENPDEVRDMFSTGGVVKALLKKIPVRTGSARVEKITDFTPQKNFMEAFTDFMNKKHNGNFSAAAEAIGQDRNKIRGIFDRVREAETGTRKGGIGIGTGAKKISTVSTPKNLIPYTDATTKVKTDKNFLKDRINNFNKNKFYSPTDIGNILGVDVSNKVFLDNLTADLKRFGVANKATTGRMKKFKLGDAVNKITKGYEKKLVKGQRTSATERLKIDNKLDPDLKNFFGNFANQARKISKEEDIFVPNAIEDVGHPLSVKITDKYPKLTKNSNINKINTLTFQDPIVNRGILEATGYESKHDILLKRLNKLVGKKIGSKEIEELQEIKNTMNALHSKAVDDVANLSKEGTSLYNPGTKKTTTYQGEYFKGQENRIPKIDINIPKQGQTFKSENLFVDMSNVNPAFRVGLVDQINPNAKFFKDLNKEQKEIYKRNVLDQTKFNLDKFYTKAGFPREQINDLKDSLEFGTSSKLGIGTVGVLGLGSTAAAAADGTEAGSILPETVAAGTGAAAVGTKKGRQLIGKGFKAAGKALAPLAIPLEAGFMINEMQKGKSMGEVLASPFMLQTAAQGVQDVSRMTPVERQAKTRELIESDKSDLSSDFYTPDLQGIESVNLAGVQERLNTQRELNRQARIASEAPELIDYYGEGFKEGGPIDKGRRKFIKGMGILAALPFIGKYIKPATKAVETAAPVVAEGVKLGYDKFLVLVEKIKKLGTPNKRRTQNDLEEATVYRGEDGSEYELVEDLASGDVRVTRDKYGMKFGGDEAYDTIEDRSTFYLKKGQADETTKGRKPPDEYDEVQEVPSRDGTFDDVDDIKDDIVKEIEQEITGKKGFYKGGLTDTTPPKRGPMNQGIAGVYQNL